MFLLWKRIIILLSYIVDVQGEGAEAGGAAGGGVVNTPAQPGGNQVPSTGTILLSEPCLPYDFIRGDASY